MALSRIWAAFIIVSVLVAGIKYVSSPADKDIFSTMVIGKAKDTIRVAPPAIPRVAQATYKIQEADGLIETCKAAVNLSLGLIGIMGFFMGLMSIAEAAGGIRIERGATGCRNAVWYSSVAAVAGGRVARWDKVELVVEPIDEAP